MPMSISFEVLIVLDPTNCSMELKISSFHDFIELCWSFRYHFVVVLARVMEKAHHMTSRPSIFPEYIFISYASIFDILNRMLMLCLLPELRLISPHDYFFDSPIHFLEMGASRSSCYVLPFTFLVYFDNNHQIQDFVQFIS